MDIAHSEVAEPEIFHAAGRDLMIRHLKWCAVCKCVCACVQDFRGFDTSPTNIFLMVISLLEMNE